MVAADIPTVTALEKQLSPHPWDKSFFADSLHQHSSWVLDDGGRLLGFLVFSQVADQAELLNVGVFRPCQGRGYGRQLVEFFVSRCRARASTLFLEVREGNKSARALYESVGFCEAGLRRGYYITPQGREDAIVMAMDLTADALFWQDDSDESTA